MRARPAGWLPCVDDQMNVANEMTTETTRLARSAVLHAKLAAVRRKFVGVAAGTGVSMALGAFVILLGLAMLTDWWLDLPLAVRAVTLALTLGGTGLLLWRHVFTPVRRQPDDDTVALAVEKGFPQFRSRLISSIQFPRPGAVPAGTAVSLARLTIEGTEEMAAPMDFTEIVATKEFKKTAAWAVAVVALGLYSFMAGGQVSRDLLKRAFLSSVPVPRHTRVELVGGDRTVGRGDTVVIEALAHGIVPRTGRLIVKSSGRRTQEYVMEKDKTGKFARSLENVQDTFSYVVELNDGSSKAHQVGVVPRPTVATVQCEQVYPAYTKLPNAKRPLGDLTLLAGSRLKLVAAATKDIKQAVIRLAGVSNDIPMQVDAKNPRELRGEFTVPARGLTGFSIEMLDTGGMESRDPAVYRVDVIPDRVPKVKITAPERKEELVTRYAIMDLGFEGTDDFQVSKVRLRYKHAEIEDAEVKTVELDLGTNAVRELRRRYEWKIRDFQPPLAEGTRLEFWLEMEDNNDVTGPGIGTTEHQLVRVVSKDEKRADLLNMAGDYLGTISDVTGDQEKLNLRLGELIREKPVATP
jgi:hypothetical protein